MEMNSWSFWLRNWWRLKPKRRKSNDNNSDDIDGSNDEFNGDDGDKEEICYCDDCINGDIDLCSDPSDGIDSDGSLSSNSGKQVIVGVCAMSKKSQSKPMKEILTRLQEFEYIRIIVFLEEVILKEPVEQWPICDCLISFHSKGFPLDKAIQYALLRKPYVINNLHMQYDIQDRRKVYSILESEGIEIPRYAVLDRDSPDPKQHELVESEDHVEVNGVIFNKPFVEKPVSAEDHNIYIYYPTSAGGGSQRLFRKIGSRSSVYSPESRVRKTGSFIYEDFMPTDGTDVKVYTVGPDYAHAEARKSPALDGKVERDSEGKEIRYPVILSNAEKLISRKVCLAFKQTVCGFDLLRANGKSYVCDVNGFSFVKNSNKYYDDCAKILGNMILRELAPTLHIPWSVPFQLDDPPIVPTTFGKMMELRCVVAIIRHGDRTPKQKMKVEVRHQKFFEIFEKYDGYKHGHIKLKRPKQLQEILDIARSLLTEIQTKAADNEIEEKQGKLEQLKSVLEMYGHFSGINRKVQMKYQPKGRPRGSSSDDGNISSNGPKDPSLVLILKWGGELTPAGRIQAEELGRIFRCMYPGGQGRNEYSGTQGLGLLRLHSTFRHDLKIYASDEGRVQMTAAAFAKGLLALEGELTPILVQMVKSANTNGLLDNDCDSSKYQNMAKNRLHDLMQIDRDFTTQDRDAINPGNSISINQAMDFVKNPVKCCAHVHSLIQSLLAIIIIKRDDQKTRDAILYHGETWELMGRRWGKIEKDFSTKSKQFDISKIPDIYDCIKYDLQHNQHTLQYEQAEELYIYAKYLADIVIPQEYGLNMQEKLTIGQGICTPLLKKIKADLQRNIEEVGDESVNRLNPRYSHGVSSPGRHVRTRLYFTSESHVHSLLTVLRYGGLADIMTDEQWRRAMEYVSMVSELNYMSQIVIMLYEDPTKDPCSEERFHVELHFSPGVNCCVQKNLPPGPGFRPHSRNDSGTSKNASGEEECSTTRIEEEGDLLLEEDFGTIHTTVRASSESPKSPLTEECEPSEFMTLPKIFSKSRHHNSSNPISIGSHHTVSGHEAMDLAKRLNEELASQLEQQSGSSLGSDRTLSPDGEPRARSLEQRHQKSKDTTSSTTTTTSQHHNTTSNSSSNSSTSAIRRQRHGIAGQINYFKLLGFGGFNKKMTTSANSLFSTAVISGSSSAPNLRDMIPNTIISPSVLEGFGGFGVPPIRPLETLHNSLSLKQIDAFLEKMTTAPLFKTPASSPPKNPSTPVPTPPTQTPQNSLPRTAAQLSWSGQSSMTSSTSAMSSGGPSSPNISDFYSRGGCPSSDMSASLISNDGMGVLGATSEFSQMFPVLDYDLSSVGAQLTLDQIDGSYHHPVVGGGGGGHCHSSVSNNNLLMNTTTTTTENSGDLTPISCSSDWEFNTNDATKGSTTNELCTEEEEEETTLSTDTTGDFCLSSDQIDLINNLNTTSSSSSLVEANFDNNLICNKTNKNTFYSSKGSSGNGGGCGDNQIFDFKNIKNDTTQPPLSSSTSGTPKIENKFRNSRSIQKQISLYEKDTTSTIEYKNLSFDSSGKFAETPANLKIPKLRNNSGGSSNSSNMIIVGGGDTSNFLSAGDLEKSISDIEKNLSSSLTLDNQKEKCIKTKSCVNLKTTCANNPGAVLIKESFIEPPKRIAKSFHGKTQFSNLGAIRRSSEQTPTLIDINQPSTSTGGYQPQVPPQKLSNIKILQRQYSTPNSCNNGTATRFKTTLVKENLPPTSTVSIDVEALDNACSLEDEKIFNELLYNKNNLDDNK